ncbi:hypothetical protein JF531_09285 [Microbacterium esteraromaticum]|uniref:hypothetical protein n=1 Tax=Microbacterium esteraromaticum TaxID=57043 RepID=UPI001A902EE5|nr:hypothetical protein [Microbacterium esteraromaticum]MBN8424713.1 hypothetical protein [Microbacterium esteraromaticum]
MMTSAIPTTTTPAEMLAKLRAQLPAALPTTMSATATPGNDLYEAYLFGLILEAAKIAGYTVEIRDSTKPAKQLHLRRSPGRIYSIGAPGRLYTHALLKVGNRPPLEVHTGVKFVGRSKVLHEADVLVIPQKDADRSRAAAVDPHSKSAFLIIEAKYWTKAVKLGTGREFLGLRRDSSAKAQVFVCTIAKASAIALLAGSPGVEYDDGVLPNRAVEESLRYFVHRLLRDYRDRQ